MGRSSDDEQMRLWAYTKRKFCASFLFERIWNACGSSPIMQEVFLKGLGIQRTYYWKTDCFEVWYDFITNVLLPNDITAC